jgi:hypothetical protein
MTNVFVVVDHVCEADIVVGVFSTAIKARDFMKVAVKEKYGDTKSLRYESLEAIEFYVDDL